MGGISCCRTVPPIAFMAKPIKDCIERAICVSTAHVTAEDGALLRDPLAPLRMAEHDMGVATILNIAYDYPSGDQDFLWVIQFYSNAMQGLLQSLRAEGVTYLILDADGNVLEDFPLFDW